MKKILFSGLVAASFIAGNAMAEGCLYSSHSKMVESEQADEVILHEQIDPELLALLLQKKKTESEQTVETLVTYN